jgi:hypothetical protein
VFFEDNFKEYGKRICLRLGLKARAHGYELKLMFKDKF